ncbi:MAG: phosphohydrolase, partial [Pseudodesulfovibrio sp.]
MSVIIRKSLLELIFSGAFMKRWNDKLRPMELVEVDKQAHKMIVAWLLFLLNSRGMDVARKRALGEAIVEGGLFDYLYRLVITDIKPPVFYRIKE